MTERVLPANLAAERALLGAMILSKKAIADALDAVGEADFYHPGNAHIFAAVAAIYGRDGDVDTLTVGDELAKAGLLEQVGGIPELMTLQAEVPAISSARTYAAKVAAEATRRRIIAMASDLAESAYESSDVDGLVEEAERAVAEVVTGRRDGRDSVHFGSTLPDWLDHMDARCQHQAAQGVETGWYDLDALLAGLRPGQLVTVAARPSMGKSAWSGNLALHAASAGQAVLAVSLEMSLAELHDRYVASEAQVPLDHVRSGRLTENDWARVTLALPGLSDLPLWVLDDPETTMAAIRSAARRVRQRTGGLGLLIVDYVQLVVAARRSENRQVEVAELSRSLKKLAQELAVPVVSLAQLNRQVEQRADKRPMLSDLRDSGAIEQDSDVVVFLYRDEVYHPETTDPGVCEVIVAKQRNGPIGTVRLSWDGRYGVFRNMTRASSLT